MTPRDLALRIAALTILEERVKAARDEARQEIMQALNELGGDSVRAELPDGTRIGKVSISAPKPTPRVTDEEKFTAWVAQEFPSEVVWHVRDSFKRAILDKMRPTSFGAVYTETGEVVQGVTFAERDPFTSCRFDAEGREALVDAMRAGQVRIDLVERPQITDAAS